MADDELGKLYADEVDRAQKLVASRDFSTWQEMLASALYATNVTIATYMRIHEVAGHDKAQKWMSIVTQDLTAKFRVLGIDMSVMWTDRR